jgi:lipopolysaccharide transport system ATP-binding protein
MYARLGFSVAAHLDPDILVIDEVLSVGDFAFQRKSLQKMRSIASGGATVLFVSHNLKAVSDLCPRAVLMDAGAIIADGPSSQVLQTYLARERAKLREDKRGDVQIQSVDLRNATGTTVHFTPGEKAWVDVTFHANRACAKVAVVLTVLDEHLGEVFNTSSERLGHATIDLEQDRRCSMTFELDMHLTNGTFHVGVFLYRYDVQRELDRVVPACTFFVESEVDVRGGANLYPKLVATGLS